MNVVPRVNTPVSAEGAKLAVEDAYRIELGHGPNTSHELPLLMALVWIETGRGKSVQNFNLGNISADDRYSGDVWRPTWYELSDNPSARDTALHAAMLKHSAPQAFRAYDDLESGAIDFVRQLHGTFPEVLEAAADGNPAGFRDALAKHYSKDYASTPPANFESLAKEFGYEGSSPKTHTVGVIKLLAVVGVAGTLAYAAKSLLSRSEPEPDALPVAPSGK